MLLILLSVTLLALSSAQSLLDDAEDPEQGSPEHFQGLPEEPETPPPGAPPNGENLEGESQLSPPPQDGEPQQGPPRQGDGPRQRPHPQDITDHHPQDVDHTDLPKAHQPSNLEFNDRKYEDMCPSESHGRRQSIFHLPIKQSASNF
ncbi:hypothetical protein AB1E18_004292 [Capra hircus]